MLSVCIPVYNIKAGNLVKALSEQIIRLDVPVEIILIDDHSDAMHHEENKTLASENVKYMHLPENIGRARIRNLFTRHIKFDYLLFLDCDSGILDNNFLAAYILQIKKGERVICGGRVYADVPPGRDKLLHWQYGRKKESKPAKTRQMNPYTSFMTNNFVVERKIFETVQLDERLNGYGHEDTLFGYELKRRGILVTHIDNPVLHADLHTNKVFLYNTESALRNLNFILVFMDNNNNFTGDITLLQAYQKINNYNLLFVIRFFYRITSPVTRQLLCAGFANMFLLDFYKLGYFSVIRNKSKRF